MAPQRLTHRAALNVVATLLDYGAKLAVGFLITPFLVAGLGDSLFGVWQILGKLVSYMSAADGRPAAALTLVVANQQAVADPSVKRRHVGSALAVYLIFLPLLALLGTVLVWFSPALTNAPADHGWEVRLACALLVVNFLLANLATLPESVLRGMNLGYKRMGLQAGLNLIGGALTAVALHLGTGLIGIAAAQTLLSVITGILFLIVVKKYVAWFGSARPSAAELWRFMRLSFWNLSGSLIFQLNTTLDVVILGIVASASAVASYTLTGYAAQAALGSISFVLIAASPGLGGLVGQKCLDRAAALRREILVINWSFATVVGSAILLWNRSFLQLWVGSGHYAGLPTDVLIVLIMVQTIFIRSDAYLIDLTLQLRNKVIASALTSALTLGLALLLTPRFYSVGLCLGILGGRAVQTVFFPRIVNAYLQRPGNRRAALRIRPWLVTSILFGVAAYFSQYPLATTWLTLPLGMLATLLLFTAAALFLGLPFESRRALFRRLAILRLGVNG